MGPHRRALERFAVVILANLEGGGNWGWQSWRTRLPRSEAYGSLRVIAVAAFPESASLPTNARWDPGDEKAVRALATYLEPRQGRKGVAEVLLCWVGDENEPPLPRGRLPAPGFRFRRGEILRFSRARGPLVGRGCP